jgi:DNA-binding transcriptional MocR family regulator
VKKEAGKYEADLTWFKIWKSMVAKKKDGTTEAGMMGANAYLVYCILKGNSEYHTGESFPTLDAIAKMAGMTKPTANKALKKLEELGHVKSKPKGKGKNAGKVYSLQETMTFQSVRGGPPAVAQWDYVPQLVAHVSRELEQFKKDGDPDRPININVNIQVGIGNDNRFHHVAGDNSEINVNSLPDSQCKEVLARVMQSRTEEEIKTQKEKIAQLEKTISRAAGKMG